MTKKEREGERKEVEKEDEKREREEEVSEVGLREIVKKKNYFHVLIMRNIARRIKGLILIVQIILTALFEIKFSFLNHAFKILFDAQQHYATYHKYIILP